MSAQLTHWRQLGDSKYFGSWDIPPGGEVILTIKSAAKEEVEGENGKKEKCGVIHFVEDVKPLVANVTNRKMIAKVTGSNYAEEWTGKKIALESKKVKAFGEVVDAVRVKDKVIHQNQQAEKIYCTDCRLEIKDQDGFKAADIIKRAVGVYNVPLCMGCAMKRKQNPPKEYTPSEFPDVNSVKIHGEEWHREETNE